MWPNEQPVFIRNQTKWRLSFYSTIKCVPTRFSHKNYMNERVRQFLFTSKWKFIQNDDDGKTKIPTLVNRERRRCKHTHTTACTKHHQLQFMNLIMSQCCLWPVLLVHLLQPIYSYNPHNVGYIYSLSVCDGGGCFEVMKMDRVIKKRARTTSCIALRA